MSQLSTMPIFKCRVCGKPIILTKLCTTIPDEDCSLLNDMIKGIAKVAICDDCRKREIYLLENNRGDEINYNPDTILLSNDRIFYDDKS